MDEIGISPMSGESNPKRIILAVQQRLVSEFSPAAKKVANAGAELIRSLNETSRNAKHYCTALDEISAAAQYANHPDSKKYAAHIAEMSRSLEETLVRHDQIVEKFSEMINNMTLYCRADVKDLQLMQTKFKKAEKRLLKQNAKGLLTPNVLEQFYREQQTLAVAEEQRRYMYFDDKHNQLFIEYGQLMRQKDTDCSLNGQVANIITEIAENPAQKTNSVQNAIENIKLPDAKQSTTVSMAGSSSKCGEIPIIGDSTDEKSRKIIILNKENEMGNSKGQTAGNYPVKLTKVEVATKSSSTEKNAAKQCRNNSPTDNCQINRTPVNVTVLRERLLEQTRAIEENVVQSGPQKSLAFHHPSTAIISRKNPAGVVVQQQRHQAVQLTAIHEFNASTKAQLTLAVNNRVKLIKMGSQGWALGLNVNTDEIGWFPYSFVQEN